MPLGRVNPFRLIGVFPASQAVVEWRWNLQRLERLDHRWQTNIWISSGFDEPGAQPCGRQVFLRQTSLLAPYRPLAGMLVARASSGTKIPCRQRMRIYESGYLGRLAWHGRLHHSHRPERGPYSTCMHRENASTVSYTEVTVSWQAASMRYVPGFLMANWKKTVPLVQRKQVNGYYRIGARMEKSRRLAVAGLQQRSRRPIERLHSANHSSACACEMGPCDE